ncbi:MAG: hypothetical protein AAFP04_04175 [Myxococcota bacterium]
MSDERRSLRDFDYFDERSGLDEAGDASASRGGVEPELDALFESEDVALHAELKAREARRMRAVRQLVLSASFFAVAVWFIAGYQDWIAYVFSDARPPIAVGEAVGAQRDQLVHNSFVQIEGVTLHRGLVQRIVRGVGFDRAEYHYFELSGSRGVFIEVRPDRGIQFATQVNVTGRVIDPKRDRTYLPLLREYEKRYYQERRPEERIIQVGVEPGEGKATAYVALGFLLALGALNVWGVARVLRARRPS